MGNKLDNMLSDDDISTIKSKARYWNEVVHRENSHEILMQELREEIQRLGLKTLWALEKLAQIESESEDDQL